MKVAAVVVAAGRGVRMDSDLPKVFLRLGDEAILVHAVRALCRSGRLSEIVVVVGQESLERSLTLLDDAGPWPLPLRHAVGGAERQDSVASGLALLAADVDLVAVHDGARPFAPAARVAAVIDAAAATGAALLAVPSRDTVKLVNDAHLVTASPARETVWLAQTPQVFRTDLLREAHRRARDEGVVATDDAALVERLGVPVCVVGGDPANVKITTPDDLRWAEWYLQTLATPR